jgi:hypothetical protein
VPSLSLNLKNTHAASWLIALFHELSHVRSNCNWTYPDPLTEVRLVRVIPFPKAMLQENKNEQNKMDNDFFIIRLLLM